MASVENEVVYAASANTNFSTKTTALISGISAVWKGKLDTVLDAKKSYDIQVAN